MRRTGTTVAIAPDTDAATTVARRLRWQAQLSGFLGSPLYESLLEQAATDVERKGPVWAALEGHASDAVETMLGLRLMAAVHRLVLDGRAPELARFYPSAGGTYDPERAWAAFRDTVASRRAEVDELVGRPCQTNEVGRSAALLGGFLVVAGETGLPLRVLEIGASAGLNLQFDRYLYRAGGESFGDERSPVRFEDAFAEGQPPLGQHLEIVARGGCDPRPLQPGSEEDRLILMASVWADQTERIGQLRAALELAATQPSPVERAEAGQWLEQRLAEAQPGVATIVFHSIVWQYLSESERERVLAALHDAGGRAEETTPFAWLRMERGGELAEVRLTTWPGGRESLVARAGYHGRPVYWIGR